MQAARDSVDTELRRLGRSGLLSAGRLHMLALDNPTGFEERLGPALCMSVSGLFGGPRELAMSSAAAVELARGVFGASRGEWAGVEFGSPTARMAGRGRMSLAVQALLQHVQRLNPDAAMRTLEVHAEMAREYAAGKRTLASWMAERRWDIDQLAYVKVVCRTRAWSAFVAPLMCGVVIANASEERARLLRRFAVLLGTATYVAREADDPYIRSGRRSLPVLHALQSAEPGLREELLHALCTPKDPASYELVEGTIDAASSLAYTRSFARHLARQAEAGLDQACSGLPPSEERAFLDAIIERTLWRTRPESLGN
ncbi:MAG: hypothetical protein ACE37F_21180 [Nannocystaceae bacterium]|nr:class 1 isoprenoid biosynthesis enzyme [bacterium]